MGESSRRATPATPVVTSISRNAGIGSDLPFITSGSTGSAATASRTRRIVSPPSRTEPGSAACSSRAATFTASPVTSVCPCGSPATTSPVLTPIRAASETPWSRSSSLLSTTSASHISPAARTARSASSSCTFGTPKTAITASPMNFSTVPPWRSSAARISSKYRDMTRRSDSGSSRSPIAVEPVTSQKTTVTVLRVSCCTARDVSGAAQAGQNAKSSGLSRPQFAQVSMRRG